VGLVDTAPVINIYHRDRPRLLVNPVNDPITAPAGAVPIIQRRQQPSTHTVGNVQQRPLMNANAANATASGSRSASTAEPWESRAAKTLCKAVT
jgi:hypothetical protein